MAFKAYLPVAFSHTHENIMFDALAEKLSLECARSPGQHFLIGNFPVEGEELDALFIKDDAICVVEFKHCGGTIRFSELGPWLVDKTELKCVKLNPLRQVKGYIYTVRNYLQKRQDKFLTTSAKTGLPFIHGMVVFGKAFELENYVPGKSESWFHVCDVCIAATKLPSLRDRKPGLLPNELDGLLQAFDVTDRYLYRIGTPVATYPSATKQRRFRKFRIAFHKDSRFRDTQNQMRLAGGAKSQGVVRVLSFIEQVRKGINAFSVIPFRGDARIANSAIYSINEQCELAGIRSEETFYPFFIGDPEEVDSWLEANEGLVLTVDGCTKRIATTIVLPEQTDQTLQVAAPTTDNRPFLKRISNLNLFDLVPATFIRKALEHLDETSADDEILEILDSVPIDDVRKFLHDVINLVRAGDLHGAETRIRLRDGEACPIVDAASVESDALLNTENSDQILLINDLDDRQMAQLLDPRHFQEWMLFLHPDQKRLAEGDFERPVVLTGVSGSGKTCILVHRARYLARKYPGERIAIMTLNRALADLLRNLVRQLCTDDESKNIQVMAFYDYFQGLLHDLGPDRYLEQLQARAPDNTNLRTAIRQVNRRDLANEMDARSGETAEDSWDDCFNQQNEEAQSSFSFLVNFLQDYRIDVSRYLRDECTLIRSGLAITERSNYLNVEKFQRVGRGTRPQFLLKHRTDMLEIILLFEEWMMHGAVLDVVELTQALTPLWKEIRDMPAEKRFRCVLVDEFQDLSTLDLRLLRHVPCQIENGLFLAGDTIQRILVKQLRLLDAGFGRGNYTAKKIHKNFRNSRQILRAASKLANHYASQANIQGEDLEVLDPELAMRETNPPIALKTNNAVRRAWEIAMECIRLGPVNPWTVCIATASPDAIPVESILEQKPEGMRAELLTGDCINNPETLVVGTMQNLKGFEFTLVLIVGCEAGAIPSPGIPSEESWREALRLYVAMTRARDQVYLIYERTPSEFIAVMNGEIVHREESTTTDYEIDQIAATRILAGEPETRNKPQNQELELDLDESCESEFNEAERDLLHTYFARHVYEKPNAPCNTFREWMKRRHLLVINFGLLAMLGRSNKRAFQSLRHKFIRLRLS